jgi:2-polyprenyl-3-methyl-5-hydroxy-6-metoxy-1,4-benzoquinol methylase
MTVRAPSTAACRVCGGTALTVYYRQGPWRVARCRCGHFSTVPWPTGAELADAYARSYYETFGLWSEDPDAQSALLQAYEQRIALIERFATPPGRLIEIGTAMGAAVVGAQRRGWTAVGYDTSTDAVAAGRALFGDIVREGTVEDALARETPADVVAAYHVLEHTPAPKAFLDNARELLRDGGLLVVEVPHVRSFDARFLPAVRERILDVPRHLCHFTPATLTRLMTESGFDVVHVDGSTTELWHRWHARANGAARPAERPSAIADGQTGIIARVARRFLSGKAFCVYARRVPASTGNPRHASS